MIFFSAFRFPVFCLAFGYVLASAFPSDKVIPAEEGWIEGDSDAVWSKKEPNHLGVRMEGEPRAWATYLRFRLPDDGGKPGDLILHSEEPCFGDFNVYGLADADWFKGSLSAQNAPGWDAGSFTVHSDLLLLASLHVDSDMAQTELRFSSEQLREFLGHSERKDVTLIITNRRGRSIFLVSNAAATDGPYLEWLSP